MKYSSFVCSIFIWLSIFIFIPVVQSETPKYSDCGRLDLVPTDIRSFTPWTVAVFRKAGSSSTRWKFHTSGTIFGPGLVQSSQAGPVGRFPSDKDPRNFLIVAGVNTTDFTKHDHFAQYSRVTFVQPLRFNDTSFDSFYHYVHYYLETPLNFSTPYVRALCAPYFALNPKNQFLKSWRAALDAGLALSPPFSGFASGRTKYGNETHNGDKREWTLKLWKFSILPEKVCASMFRFYYGQSLSPVCFKRTNRNYTILGGTDIFAKANFPPEYSQNDDELCFSPGSKSQGAVGAKWYSALAASLIPGRKWDRCDKKTVYFSALSISDPHKYSSSLQYAVRLEKCGLHNILCASLNSSQCIPINKTCDDVPDCEDESDEHPDICAWKTGPAESKKLEPVQLNSNIVFDPQDLTRKCPDFEFLLDGVRCIDPETLEHVSCTSPFYYGRRIRVECDQFYTAAKYSFDHMDLFCNFEGQWIGYRPIYCQKECGILDETRRKTFPWEISIFEDGIETCRGTLIRPAFVLTDGRCVKKWIESPKARSTIHISPADDLPLLEDKAAKFQIRNSWVSSNSGATADKYENGVALIQILKPTEESAKNLNLVMAACFLVPPLNNVQLGNQVAMVSSTKPVVVSREESSVVTRETFYTESSVNPGNSLFGISCVKIGAGLFFTRVETSTGKSRHVLQGIYSSAIEDGRGTFKNVDSHADWILDILEANS